MVMPRVRRRDILVSKEMPVREETGCMGIAGMKDQPCTRFILLDLPKTRNYPLAIVDNSGNLSIIETIPFKQRFSFPAVVFFFTKSFLQALYAV
jgi:hypothetical protein